MISRFILFSIVLFLPLGAKSEDGCPTLEKKTAVALHPAEAIEAWESLASLQKILKVEYLFPSEFVSEVQAQQGLLELSYAPIKAEGQRFGGVKVEINTTDVNGKSNRYLKANLFRRKDVEGAVEVDGLVLQNHLIDKSTVTLAADQVAPGLPAPVFKHAMLGLMTTLSKGPFTSVYMESSQHYGVMKLYERVAKFEPFGEQVAAHFEMLENYRSLARKWPEEIRIRRIQDFVESIGAFNTTAVDASLNKVWDTYQKTGGLPENHKVIKGSQGEAYAIVRTINGKNTVRFVNQQSYDKLLYDWKQSCIAGRCRMIRKVDFSMNP